MNADINFFAGLVDSLLCGGNGRGGLKGSFKNQRRSVSHTSQGSAGMIGFLLDFAITDAEGIVVGKAGSPGGIKAVSNLEAFDCADGEDGFRQICIDFFKDRIPQADRESCYDTLADTAGRVGVPHTLIQVIASFLCGNGIRHVEGIVCNLGSIKT